MPAHGFAIRTLDPGSNSAAELLALSDAHMARLYPAASNHPVAAATLATAGTLFIGAYAGGSLAGCAATRLLDGDGRYGEIKRLFVLDRYRGRGIARALMERLEQHLRDHGVDCARLETGVLQPEARALYLALGYTERAAFGEYAPDPLSLFMEKRLTV